MVYKFQLYSSDMTKLYSEIELDFVSIYNAFLVAQGMVQPSCVVVLMSKDSDVSYLWKKVAKFY